MTSSANVLHALLPLVGELSSNLPETERYRRLLAALRTVLPADAAALLRYEKDELGRTWLRPLAIDGLTPDTLGRRFRVDEHPRFATLMQAATAYRFDPHTPLPDPYDGLVEHHTDTPLPVHDCMGCVLMVEQQPWGLLTLDALQPGQFQGPSPLEALQAFSNLAAATVATAARMRQLEFTALHERQRAEHFRKTAQPVASSLQGKSLAMQTLQRDITAVAASDLTVLITGETGTGKELVAQAIHHQSRRADQVFVSVNCAALPDSLMESELFGHVRGAFSGATGDRLGKFEQAHLGTLFLDEVAELSMSAQAKLLRVLQSGHIQRLGMDKERYVDVRIIAATNQPLDQAVREGRMRADFYHRLCVYPLQVPALRDREADVLLLSGYFLEQTRSQWGLSGIRLDTAVQQALLEYPWPGNVRELEHTVRRAVVHALRRQSAGSHQLTITLKDLALTNTLSIASYADGISTDSQFEPQTLSITDTNRRSLRDSVEQYERQLVQQALTQNGHSWAAAARALQMDRANLQRLAKRLGIALIQSAAQR